MTPAAGFTGTRDGMTSVQVMRFLAAMSDLRGEWGSAFELHHGCCVGADEQAVLMARALNVSGNFNIVIIGHPPAELGLASDLAMKLSAQLRPAKPYIERNHDIVDETQHLIATPHTAIEKARSGTWATVRYSRKLGKSREVIGPAGEVLG